MRNNDIHRLYLLGIVFDTHNYMGKLVEGVPTTKIGIVFDTYVFQEKSSLIAGYRFRYQFHLRQAGPGQKRLA